MCQEKKIIIVLAWWNLLLVAVIEEFGWTWAGKSLD